MTKVNVKFSNLTYEILVKNSEKTFHGEFLPTIFCTEDGYQVSYDISACTPDPTSNKKSIVFSWNFGEEHGVECVETTDIKVNGAWYLDSLPTMIVIEKEDNTLAMFYINPFKLIEDADLKYYKGHHPRKCKGQPLPAYLYRFYGLTKSEETANEVIHIRLTPSEKERVQTAADGAGKNVSEFIRDYIRGL